MRKLAKIKITGGFWMELNSIQGISYTFTLSVQSSYLYFQKNPGNNGRNDLDGSLRG